MGIFLNFGFRDKQDFVLRLGMWELLSLRKEMEDILGKADLPLSGKSVLDVGTYD